jgi:hypothetical protein
MYGMPVSVWTLELIGVIGILATTCVALYRGALVAGVERRAAVIVSAVAASGFGGWLVVSALLARAGVYSADSGKATPWFGLAAGGFLVALLLAAQIPIVRRILAAPGTTMRLTLPHTFRVAGVLFLVVMARGDLPAAFAMPAGLGDIAVGIFAPFVARRLHRNSARSGALHLNVAGLADLVVALSIGFLLFGAIPVNPSTAALRTLPLALVPTVAVPLAVALHIVSLRRLRLEARPAQQRSARFSRRAADRAIS